MARTKKHRLKVTQSMIKEVRKYLKMLTCGLVLESKYITGTYPVNHDESPAMTLGHWFEYYLSTLFNLPSGKVALPKSGIVPVPLYMDSELKKVRKGDDINLTDQELAKKHNFTEAQMYAEYRRACVQARRVAATFKEMGIEVLDVSVTITDKNGNEGTLDIIAMYNGQKVIIDVKYSGLTEDRWHDLGWMFTEHQTRHHATQAIHYHMLGKMPFIYCVVSSAASNDEIMFFEMEIDEDDVYQHKLDIADTREKMELYRGMGFTPYPEMSRCKACGIAPTCAFKKTVPDVRKVSVKQEQL